MVNLETIKEEPVSDVRSTPILFVHGMWHAAWCWSEHFLPYFARHGYVSHALTLRGHGGSEGWERLRWTSLAEYVSDVEQVVGHIGRPPVLVGHSMGGGYSPEVSGVKWSTSCCAVGTSATPRSGTDYSACCPSASAGIHESQLDDEHVSVSQHAATGAGCFLFSGHARR